MMTINIALLSHNCCAILSMGGEMSVRTITRGGSKYKSWLILAEFIIGIARLAGRLPSRFHKNLPDKLGYPQILVDTLREFRRQSLFLNGHSFKTLQRSISIDCRYKNAAMRERAFKRAVCIADLPARQVDQHSR